MVNYLTGNISETPCPGTSPKIGVCKSSHLNTSAAIASTQAARPAQPNNLIPNESVQPE